MAIKINTNNTYSAVKTINHALQSIGAKYGTNAHQLEQMRAVLDIALGSDATYISDSGKTEGMTRLRNTAEIREKLSNPEIVKMLSNLQTAAEYSKAARKRAEEDAGEKLTEAEVVKHEQMVDDVKRAAESEMIKNLLSAQKDAGVDVSGKKSYKELYDLITGENSPFTSQERAEGGAGFQDDIFNAKNENWIESANDAFNGGIGRIEKL